MIVEQLVDQSLLNVHGGSSDTIPTVSFQLTTLEYQLETSFPSS